MAAVVKPVYVDTRCLFPSASFRNRHAEDSGHEATEDIDVGNDAPVRYKGISLEDEDDRYNFPVQYPAGKPLGEQSDETDDTQRYIKLYPTDSISDSDSMYSRRSTAGSMLSNDSGVFGLDPQSDSLRKYERLSSCDSNDSSTSATPHVYNHLQRETDDIDGGDTVPMSFEPKSHSPQLKTKLKSSKSPPKRPKSPANTLDTLVTPRQSAIPWIPACVNTTPTNNSSTNSNNNNSSTTDNTDTNHESIRRSPRDPLPNTTKKSLSPPTERPPARRRNSPPTLSPSSPPLKPKRPTHAPACSIRSIPMPTRTPPLSPTQFRCATSLEQHAWYHGVIDRVVAENRLCEHVALRRRNGNDVNGTWLVRAKPQPKRGAGGAYAISVAFRNRKEQRMMVEHHMVERAMRVDGTPGSHFLVNGQSHKLMKSKSILEIIHCLETNADFSEIVSTRPLVLLKHPCPSPGSTAY
eukprot:m.179706 g.179706  ORF g.179706 m.179706 type:complete len:465 (-) comp31988_c1_seq2:386-1780(-)